MSANGEVPAVRIRTSAGSGTDSGAGGRLSFHDLREELAYGFLRAAGGVDGLCRELWRDFRRAKVGSAERVRIYNMIFSLFAKSEDDDIPEDEVDAILDMLSKMRDAGS